MSSTVDRDGRIAEILVLHIISRREKIWVVECIEHFRPEGEHLVFELPQVDREIALDGCVEIDLSRSEDRIAADISRSPIRPHEMECADGLRWARIESEKQAMEIIRSGKARQTEISQSAAVDPEGSDRRRRIREVRTRIGMAVPNIVVIE